MLRRAASGVRTCVLAAQHMRGSHMSIPSQQFLFHQWHTWELPKDANAWKAVFSVPAHEAASAACRGSQAMRRNLARLLTDSYLLLQVSGSAEAPTPSVDASKRSMAAIVGSTDLRDAVPAATDVK